MSEVEYTKNLFLELDVLKFKIAVQLNVSISKETESRCFAAHLLQASPPKIATSPSKKATSLPLRLGVAWPSPRGSRPLTFAFCRGLDGVWVQNTNLTLKQCILERKKENRPVAVVGCM
ncbi:hypothetical protein [Leptospira weilii]|uniref:hypothetical protein n=1 Tax=Leptospira weilii TaxID=28184 RepID=UPI001EF26CF8|nr:hypothetical protein [Leptospira weilii]ULH27675.1 hypothetical protein FH586_14875 [Leptospira weilii]ULH27689.1 hypothetical protein FH586_14945 [Leptospira weilii]